MVSCSSFEEATSVGSDVLNDIDPQNADPDAVVTHVVDSVPVTHVSSSRKSAVNKRGAEILAGRWDDYSAEAYFEFDSTLDLDTSVTEEPDSIVRKVANVFLVFQPATRIVLERPLTFALDSCPRKAASEVLNPDMVRRRLDRLTFHATNGVNQPESTSVRFDTTSRTILLRRKTILDSLADSAYIRQAETTILVDTTLDAAHTDTVTTITQVLDGNGRKLTDTEYADTVALATDTVLHFSRYGLKDTYAILPQRETERDTGTHSYPVSVNTTTTDTLLAGTFISRQYLDTSGAQVANLPEYVTHQDTFVSDTSYIRHTLNVDTIRTERTSRTTTVVPRLRMRDQRLFYDSVFADTLVRKDTIDGQMTSERELKYVVRHYKDSVVEAEVKAVSLPSLNLCLRTSESTDGLVRLEPPELHVWLTDGTLYRRSLPQYADYHVFEDRPGRLDSLPLASAASDRYAAIKLNLSPLWQALEDSAQTLGFRSLLSANVSLPLRRDLSEGEPERLLVRALLTDNAVDPMSVTDFSELSLRFHRDQAVHSTSDTTSDTTDVLVVNLRDQLDELYNLGSPTTQEAYLYINVFDAFNGEDLFHVDRWRLLEFDLDNGGHVQIGATLTNPSR